MKSPVVMGAGWLVRLRWAGSMVQFLVTFDWAWTKEGRIPEIDGLQVGVAVLMGEGERTLAVFNSSSCYKPNCKTFQRTTTQCRRLNGRCSLDSTSASLVPSSLCPLDHG